MSRRLVAIVAPFTLVLAGCTTSTPEPDPEPSASASPSATPSVTLHTATYFDTDDGPVCRYLGATEFTVGDDITFAVNNESDTEDVGFHFWRFPDGATAEEVWEEGIFSVGNDPIMGVGPPTENGKQYRFRVDTATLDPGQYGLNCYQYPGPVTETDITTMFTVDE